MGETMMAVEHDYTSMGWGHAIGMMRGGTTDDPIGVWLGHGPHSSARMKAGDVIIVEMRSGRRGRYIVEAIEYYRDPRDMWRATVRLDTAALDSAEAKPL
jgi:hypothetical protein